MNYFSTRDEKAVSTASSAILQGLSKEGGLFVPENIPTVDLSSLKNLSYPDLAAKILGVYLDDYSQEFLEKTTEQVYSTENFNDKLANLVQVDTGKFSMELWHGPTCAFKDYALQIMPKLLVESKKINKDTSKTLILVATSGDTGTAALDGYKSIEGIDIAVFYPNDGTSEIQRLQMATQEGNNVAVYAVNGNFDNVQTGLKKIFSNKELEAEMASKNINFSSANSINWGRLAPQIIYYFASYFELVNSGKIKMNDKVNYCVPTGNFGDILAGYYAKKMGLPIGRLICASNKNNVLADFFETGTYKADRDFFKTSSPSMDILISSNLERLLYHISQNTKYVGKLMRDLSETGSYTVDEDILEAINQDFACGFADDDQVEDAIRNVFKTGKYLSDTHTAVAFKVHEDYQKKTGDKTATVICSTASPYKFAKSVIGALGGVALEDDFQSISMLENMTNIESPKRLSSLKDKKVLFEQVIEQDDIIEVIRNNY